MSLEESYHRMKAAEAFDRAMINEAKVPKLNSRDVVSLMTGLIGSLLSAGLADGTTLVLAVKKFQDQGMEYLSILLDALPKMEGQFEDLVEEHLAKDKASG